MKPYTHSIDLIEELRNLTMNDTYFDANEWCQWDIDELRRIANFIEREMKYLETN